MLDEFVEQLRQYRAEEIAAATGYSFSSVSALLSGRNRNPTLKFIEALQRFLESKE